MPGSASKARRAVSLFSTLNGFAGDDLSDIETAVGEAVANAIEHGSRPSGAFSIACSFDCGTLTVEISDSGTGFDDASQPVHDVKERRTPSSRGYGIYIMRAMMDRVTFKDGGTTVVLEKRSAKASSVSRKRRESAP